jgi:membrane-anchored protein YejM (alkaline phosphatase superfamily)
VRTERHRSDYTGVMAQAEDILRDSRIRFVFLHLPVPHPPGIFDRRLHKLSDRGTYLDNLALADQTLGELRSILQATPAADNTTLILSSDHSWRTFMWQGTEDWSAEGTRATDGGHFDKRPVLMVQLPRSDSGQVIAKPLNLLVVHSILDALLHGQVHTPADLALVSPEVQEATDVQSHN